MQSTSKASKHASNDGAAISVSEPRMRGQLYSATRPVLPYECA